MVQRLSKTNLNVSTIKKLKQKQEQDEIKKALEKKREQALLVSNQILKVKLVKQLQEFIDKNSYNSKKLKFKQFIEIMKHFEYVSKEIQGTEIEMLYGLLDVLQVQNYDYITLTDVTLILQGI